MDFRGLRPADLAEVRSLNSAFLYCLKRERSACRWRDALPDDVLPRLKGLSELQRERLASAPFLLLSLRESEPAFWRCCFAGETGADLFAASDMPDTPCEQLASAALSFLWALARQNPYAVRLLCGAPLDWCDALSEQALLPLLRAAGHADTVCPRLAARPGFWRRLLKDGLSSNTEVRHAAHLSAMQTVLTRQAAAPSRELRAAACYSRVPSLELSKR